MRRKSPLSAFLSLLLLSTLLSTFLAVPAHAELSWNVQIVDENAAGYGNGYCPIVVDSNNTAHIAYTGQTPPNIYNIMRYASWNGSGWNIQQHDSYASVHDLALDANGDPHITLGSLAYGTWNGKGWNFQTVTTDRTSYSSLALDSSGNPHVAYITGDKLKYATRSRSNWTIQTVTVDNNLLGIIDLSLALDSNDTPYIMYYTFSSYVDSSIGGARFVNVKLALWKNSGWSIETVLASSSLGDFGNMVLDSKGYPHFLATLRRYLSAETPTLLSTILYVSWDGFAWNVQTVASDVTLASIGFLALDSNDFPHISYITRSLELMYARWTGTDWSVQNVNSSLSVRGPCYIAVGSDGNPHISYLANPPEAIFPIRIVHMMYATANVTEPSEVSPTFPVLPLLLASTAVIIGAIILTVYFKKRRH